MHSGRTVTCLMLLTCFFLFFFLALCVTPVVNVMILFVYTNRTDGSTESSTDVIL